MRVPVDATWHALAPAALVKGRFDVAWVVRLPILSYVQQRDWLFPWPMTGVWVPNESRLSES
jgi:hypothetical protein